jgi:hypothetical protein
LSAEEGLEVLKEQTAQLALLEQQEEVERAKLLPMI